MLAATGRYVLFSDADLSTPIEEAPRLIAAIDAGADVAIASRAFAESNVSVHQPWWRESMGRIFNLFVQRMALPGIRDSQCGFKCFGARSRSGCSRCSASNALRSMSKCSGSRADWATASRAAGNVDRSTREHGESHDCAGGMLRRSGAHPDQPADRKISGASSGMSGRDAAATRPSSRFSILGAALRLLYFSRAAGGRSSLASDRQCRNREAFAEGPFDILHPQVNWGGRGDASVEMELPLLPAIVAVFYKVFGENFLIGRGDRDSRFRWRLMVAVYVLGRRVFGEAAGRAAAFLLRDFTNGGLLWPRLHRRHANACSFRSWRSTRSSFTRRPNRPRLAVLGGVCLALAWMVKLPAFLTFGPVAFIGLRARRLAILRDRWFLGAVALRVRVDGALVLARQQSVSTHRAHRGHLARRRYLSRCV